MTQRTQLSPAIQVSASACRLSAPAIGKTLPSQLAFQCLSGTWQVRYPQFEHSLTSIDATQVVTQLLTLLFKCVLFDRDAAALLCFTYPPTELLLRALSFPCSRSTDIDATLHVYGCWIGCDVRLNVRFPIIIRPSHWIQGERHRGCQVLAKQHRRVDTIGIIDRDHS